MEKMDTKDVLYALGRPFSPIYSYAMHLREMGYKKGWFKQYAMGVPVVSVGNLTMGGTGKTPTVQYIARFLVQQGYFPAIISRGYGGKSRSPVNVVSDGKSLLLDAVVAGDEPRFLAETLPGVPVLTGVVRKIPAEKAVTMGADVLVLDDGFQHMRIKREVNLALFNADVLAGNSRIFPGGDLREPVKALHRATSFLITGVTPDNEERAHQFGALLEQRFAGKRVDYSRYTVRQVVLLKEDGSFEKIATLELQALNLIGVSGIARPKSFHNTLKEVKANLAHFLTFPDHVPYTDKVIGNIQKQARKYQADGIITTEKDMVKLRDTHLALPIYVVQMDSQMDASFDQHILQSLLE
ncbi:MAG: tetraacyldisaccharide 4'-kinase [Desulfobulbus propionicus]|nr:MAG: tetraacyldisaccharide 4'-kinase [Desulfobulbus propionicus]